MNNENLNINDNEIKNKTIDEHHRPSYTELPFDENYTMVKTLKIIGIANIARYALTRVDENLKDYTNDNDNSDDLNDIPYIVNHSFTYQYIEYINTNMNTNGNINTPHSNLNES
ncbi:hypothetical protein M8J77_024486 [Diaphorina citri]|nr:hypothetical protein M8J77_024486 [Diaphorina citri]